MSFEMRILEGLSLGEANKWDGLKIFPITRGGAGSNVLVDVAQAISLGWLEVTEVSESGHVPELRVRNRSDKPVIIFDGEELIGAKQNRILNVTVVVAADSDLIVPVSCVEQGRWSWNSRRFSSGGFLYSTLRREKSRQVTENLRSGRRSSTNQGMIWEHIARKSARMGVSSDTGAMRDLADRYRIDDSVLREHFPHGPEQVGYLAFIRSGFAGGDIFAGPEICGRKLYPLIRSYQLDSLDPEASFPELPAAEILSWIESCPKEPVESVGSGQELRFERPEIHGSITFFNEQLAHLAVFPQAPASPREGCY